MNIRNPKTHTRKPHSARRTAHRRGNVLILVVAVLVLMVLIGTAYIQAARNDRAATAMMNNSNIDMAIDAEIARIASLIRADVISDTGDMLDGLDGGGNKNISDAGYDPFTSREPFDIAEPDIDPWLASVTYYDNGGTLYWDNISNVTGDGGSNWTLRGSDEQLSLGDRRTEYTIPSNSDYADADGDGIRDSRWVDSAIGSVRGTRYVAAVRVIDLSALLNVNVGLALTDASGAHNYSLNDDVPRWWFPSELDANRLLQQLGAAQTEREDLLKYRLGVTSVALPTAWADRYTFWQRGPRQYANFNDGGSTEYVPLGMAEEMKLRRLNGLNSPEMLGTALDDTMRVFIRDDRDPESNYTDVPGVTAPKDYLDNEPRHQLTTASGASIVAAKFGNGGSRTLQVDLNRSTDAEIAQAIAETYAGATPGAIVPAGGYSSVDEFAAQLTAAIHDYRDADNKISKVTQGTATDRLGFEMLPYVSEVYVQSFYKVNAAGDITGTGPFTVTWTKESTTDGFAVEIVNPYNRSISIENIKLYAGGTSADLSTVAGKTTMSAQEVLVLYVNSDGTGGTHHDIAAMASGSATKIPANGFTWPTSASFDVKLTATLQDDTEWNSGYVVYPSGGMPNSFTETGVATAPAVNDTRYLQLSSRGSADGLNVMTVSKADVEEQTTANRSSTDPWEEIDQLGEPDKGNATVNGTITFGQQIVWRDDDKDLFWQAGEVAHIVVLPLTSSSTVAAAWNDQSVVTDWMLDFDSTQMVDSTDEDFAVPYAVALIGRLTTLSPLVDGADNDGDGTTDNAEEVFVPGRLNLNTVPVELLKQALPIASTAYREGLAEIIAAYRKREDVTGYPFSDPDRSLQSGYREDFGFAHIGEVMMAAGGLFGGDSVDNFEIGSPPLATRIDFLPVNVSVADGVADDREERAFALRWLGQVGTVRSDVFAAYVTVRGYPGGDFDEDPIEEIRFVAILDRSGITSADDKVKVLAVMRY
jgi:hypothetical protein